MRKSLLNFLGAAGLLMSASAYAAGLGGINVESALGQPLKADIELVALTPAEREKITVRMASPEAYKSAGLEYPRNAHRFQILNRSDGSPYLKVTTEQAVNDPFVSLLVELVWPSGRLLREYTFLLDPPGYETKQPGGGTVTAIAPIVTTQPLVESQPVTNVSHGKTVGAARVATADTRATAPANVASGTVQVRPGDTLRKIAAEHKPQEVTLERMLVGLYRGNTSQFDGNMNRLQVGKQLRLPASNELSNISQQEALKEIRIQAEDWHNYRQRLAGTAVTARPAEPVQQSASGKVSSRVADQAVSPTEKSAQEVLRLSKGEAPGDKIASAGNLANLQQEDAIALAKAAEEARMRADLLEQQLRDMERLAQLKAEASQAEAAASAPAAVASEVLPATPEVKAEPAAKPAAKPAPAPAPAPEAAEPSLVDELIGNPLLLGGAAAILLGVVGFVAVRLKRRKEQSIFTLDDDEDNSTPVITMPTVAAPAAVQMPAAPVKKEPVLEEVQPDDVDPISEAELFLNFGRDVQAEEILKDAMVRYPHNHQIHLKLLAIYAARKDVTAFAGVARVLRATGDEQAWQQAAAMGRKIDPDNPDYGGIKRDNTIEDTGSATQAIAAAAIAGGVGVVATDFLLDDGNNTNPVAPDLDFDLGGNSELDNLNFNDTLVLTSDNVDGTLESTAVNPQLADDEVAINLPPEFSGADDVAEQSTMGIDALDFDLTATDLQPVAEQPEQLAAEPTFDFDPDMTLATTDAAAPVASSESMNPSDFDFDLDELGAAPATAAADEPLADLPKETAGEVDVAAAFADLDSDLLLASEPEPAPANVAPPELDFGDLNLDVTDAAPAPAAEVPEEPVVRGENWHEVATKLDLAKAYQEMGDAVGAREILHEVLNEGDAEQQAMAQLMLSQLA